MKFRNLFFPFALLFLQNISFTQTMDEYLNTATTAIPFILISPDAQTSAMAGSDVAIVNDLNAIFHNPAKLVFQQDEMAVSANFKSGDGISNFEIFSSSAFMKLENKDALSLGFRLLSAANATITGISPLPDVYFREFAVDAAYAKKISEKFSLALGIKYLNSNFATDLYTLGNAQTDAQSIAADASCFYKTDFQTFNKQSDFSFGVHLSNLGNRMTYNNSFTKTYLPANLALGISYSIQANSKNNFLLTGEMNKLLVPTPSATDADNNTIFDFKESGLAESWITSLYDAPRGLEEEIHEINVSGGIEYNFSDMFFVRGGYFYEHPAKGNRQYYSGGLGLMYADFHLDFAYLMPGNNSQNPLDNSFAVSLSKSI